MSVPIRFRSRRVGAAQEPPRAARKDMTTCSVTSTPARFARCLANFQVDELLLLKKSVMSMEALDKNDSLQPTTECPQMAPDGSPLPERMALMAADRGDHDTTGSHGPWHSHPHAPTSWTEEKPSKLQTLFQISITALAFLSFGGYLLCLIVQAIKSKGTTYFHPVATATTSSSTSNVKRIKIYRRSKRSSVRPDTDLPTLLQQDYASYMKSLRDRGWGMLT
uniref:CG14797-PA n=1 Tax=Drosophila melanogaster TaxID=7227 RepID=B4F612_DROME|nr:CG14797-PA [Drosophila melanogaster]CAQ53616.1 CG14797-PA [Drosophila melanogaster]CAQ53617.1 CG14797-PA [Drosophila melanogaster]CAQ53619.1 CG14797-PA [Drosophila melanogaster]CAQ53620.1 CG14797-PA [Drosophila melanogaster]